MNHICLSRTRTILFVACCFLFIPFCTGIGAHRVRAAAGTTYYVSTSGSDSNNGTSTTTPFKTLGEVSNLSLNPGDSILLERGDTWHETLEVPSSGTSGDPITIGAYGSGADPIISGADPVTNWTLYNGNIYEASVASTTFYGTGKVYVDGTYYDNAHYPDTGYNIITADSSNLTSLTDTSLNPGGNIIGAYIYIRSVPWRIEQKTVTGYDTTSQTISWSTDTSYSPETGYGYYLANELWMLDQSGEWVYDPTAGKLYIWLTGNANPNDHDVELSTRQFGLILLNTEYDVVQNINIMNSYTDDVIIQSAPYNTVEDLNLSNAKNGVEFLSSDDDTIQNNTITNTISAGITIDSNSDGATISGNTITNTGYVGAQKQQETIAGISDDGGSDITINGNTVSNSGYSGIDFSGNNITVENNTVDDSCLVLDDCGGIYTYNGDNSTESGDVIRNNMVSNSIGNWIGTKYTSSQAEGIYLDNNSNNFIVSGNTVNNAELGIYLHDTYDNTLSHNTVYNPREYGLLVEEDSQTTEGAVKNNSITNNIFFGNASTTIANVDFDGELGSTDFGTYANNYYLSTPAAPYPIEEDTSGDTVVYPLSLWQSASGNDFGSKDIGTYYTSSVGAATTIAVLGSNLVDNNTFDSTVSPWYTYSSDDSSTVSWVSSCGLTSGCLHAHVGDEAAQFSTDDMALTGGDAYRISFSIVGTATSTVKAQVQGEEDSYPTYIRHQIQVTTSPQNISFIYIQPTDVADAILEFISSNADADFYIDNVSFTPVSVTYASESDDSLLYTNSTSATTTVSLGSATYCDINNTALGSSFQLGPYGSKIVLKCFDNSDLVCDNHETYLSAPNECKASTDEGPYAGLDATDVMGTNEPFITGTTRVYGAGNFRNLSETTGSLAALTITPIGGYTGSDTTPELDISITSWGTTGEKNKAWTESSSVLQTTHTTHTVGGLNANEPYTVSIDGSVASTTVTDSSTCSAGVCTADSSGDLTFAYTGGYSSHDFSLTEASSTNEAPIANAGSDQTLSPGTTSASLSGGGTDADGTIASYAWTTTSNATISSPHSADTTVTGLSDGNNYLFTLTVTDNDGATATDTVEVTVNQESSSGGGGGSTSGGSSSGGGGSISMSTNSNSSTSIYLPTTTYTSQTESTPPVFNRNLSIGSSGEDVSALQEFLIARGFTIASGITGTFDVDTQTALGAFQRSVGIASANGSLDTLTGLIIDGLWEAAHPTTASTTSDTTSVNEDQSSEMPSVEPSSFVFTRSLTIGSKGADVLALQQFLNAHGFTVSESGAGSPGNETDYFGKATEHALAKYQAAYHITPSVGYFGKLTRKSINSSENVQTTTTALEPITKSLSFGDTGSSVSAVQKILESLEILNATAVTSGTFDAATMQAVEQFQCKYNIVCSGTAETTGYGRVGPKTRTQLNALI